jgi:hypothetical protein
MNDRIGKQTVANIPVDGVEKLFLSCVFLLISATKE